MTHIGIMIEGQEDLTWERLFRLASAVEDLGFESLFRSDHLTALHGFPTRNTLELWSSLAALALRTQRIRFGPLVCSMTFRHPSLLAKMAASVDVLSGGRFELGIGAGWHQGEHHMFGIEFPPTRTRLERLDEGAQVIRALWSGQPTTFSGRHYRLEDAETHPIPVQNPPPLIIGGNGERRTLRIVARHATEWNAVYVSVEDFRHKSRVLDEHCQAIGRDPGAVRRSLMTPCVVGKNESAVGRRIEAHRAMFPGLPQTFADWRARGYLGGSPSQLVDQLKEFEQAGVQRFLFQHNELDDVASLELLAAEVLPHVH